MACTTYTLKGLKAGCRDSLGSIKKVWISANPDGVRDEIEGATGGLTTINDVSEFLPFELLRNKAQATSTLQVSENSGNSWQTVLEMTFMKQDTAKRLEIQALAMGEFVFIYEDANGNAWFCGEKNNCYCNAATAQTGLTSTDLNGYTISLVDEEIELPLQLDTATISKLQAIEIA